MFHEGVTNLSDETAKFLKGENKPTIVFEFSYLNIAVILIGLIITLTVSSLIVNALTKK